VGTIFYIFSFCNISVLCQIDVIIYVYIHCFHNLRIGAVDFYFNLIIVIVIHSNSDVQRELQGTRLSVVHFDYVKLNSLAVSPFIWICVGVHYID